MAVSRYSGRTSSARLLFAAGLFQFVTYACFFNLTPLYPQVGRDLGLDAGALGAVIGAGGVVSVLVQIPAGSGGDRWGRRAFFAGSMLVLAIAQAARWLAGSPTTLFVAQVLGGAAQGTATVNAWALVADVAELGNVRKGQAFGVLNATLALGLVAGYLLAGALGSLAGWRVMSLTLVLLPALALPFAVWVPGRSSSTQVRPGLATVLRSIADRQRLAIAVMAGLILAAGQGSLYLLPFGLDQRNLGPFAAALLLVPYVVGSVIAAPLAGRLGDRLGTGRVVAALLLVGALADVALIWGTATSVALIGCFILIGASVNGALPLLAVRVLELRDSRALGVGTQMAGLRIGQSSGTFVGPAVAGAVFVHAGLNVAWLTLAAGMLASLALQQVARTSRFDVARELNEQNAGYADKD